MRNDDRELIEADESLRETGAPSILFEPQPLCFQQAYDLRQEISIQHFFRGGGTGPGYDPITNEDVKKVLQSERKCQSFTPWQLGFSPKEHREMMDRKEIRDQNHRWEGEDRQWRQSVDKQNRRLNRINLIIVAVASVLTAAAVLVAAFKREIIGLF